MTAAPARTRTGTVDRYLETIYYIAHEESVVRPGRVAEWLGVSGPTVSVALQRLARDGWIAVAADHRVALTADGEAAAGRIVRRHRLLERWLTDAMGLDWATADREAERLAPGFSDDVLDRLDEHLGRPDTCPHGNAIPGREQPPRDLVALTDLDAGATARVRRISEVAEHEAPDLLRHLHAAGLVCGAEVRVGAGGTVAGAVSVEVAGRALALGTATARLIWVEREPS